VADYARAFVVGAPLHMAMPARAVGNKAFKAGGSGLRSLFFDSTHYEKSPVAAPKVRMTMQLVRM
jgi:hypothetical protein